MPALLRHMCLFPEPSWKITKENEISLDPDGPKKAQSLNIIKGLQTLNKSLTRIEGSRKAGGAVGVGGRGAGGETSFLAPAWLHWGPLDLLCVCSFFSAVAEVSWLFLPHSLLFSSLVSHHLTPR